MGFSVLTRLESSTGRGTIKPPQRITGGSNDWLADPANTLEPNTRSSCHS